MIKTGATNPNEFLKNVAEDLTITSDREVVLKKIASYLASEINQKDTVNLTFICTHNSRRSQMAQAWAFFITDLFSLPIQSFSGGTEITAFHRNTVKALQESGFHFKIKDYSHQNPVYTVSYENETGNHEFLGFSKTYDHTINKKPYFVITTCDSADQNCPFIPEASFRFHLPYNDPKSSDGTDKQLETYLTTSKKIAIELYFLFNQVKNLI